MKNIYTKLCLSAIGCLMMASCDFLDVVPQGTATVDDIYRTQYQAEGMVLSCYANIPNYFHPQQFPDFTGGNEIITSKGGTTRWFHFRSLVYGEESPTTTYYSLWSNTAKSYPQGAVKKAVWESIRNCYNVLNNLDRVSDITPENLSWWKGEALFLIGYYHQIMLEYYGPIVIIDKEIPMESSPAEMMTSRSPYDTCVDFIANKYSEAARLLPGVWDSSKRNRATSSAALAFKARLLLYAASPLVNGNSEFYSDFKNPDGTFLINQTHIRKAPTVVGYLIGSPIIGIIFRHPFLTIITVVRLILILGIAIILLHFTTSAFEHYCLSLHVIISTIKANRGIKARITIPVKTYRTITWCNGIRIKLLSLGVICPR